MKRTNIILFSILPFLLATAIEFLMQLYASGLASIFLFFRGDGIDFFSTIASSDFSTMGLILYSIVVIVAFSIWYYASFEGELIPHPSRTLHWTKLFGILIMIPFAQYAADFILSITAFAFPKELEKYNQLMETAGISNDLSVWTFCYAIILGPIAEELIFRGITLKSIRRVFGFWGANFFQALLFGIYHMNVIQGVYAFALGLLLGFVCEAGGSIYYSILLHIGFNFCGTILSTYLPYSEDEFLLLLTFIISFILLGLACRIFLIGCRKTNTLIKS